MSIPIMSIMSKFLLPKCPFLQQYKNKNDKVFKGNLTAVSGVGSSPALATCETSQVLLAGVSGGFPGVLPFRPPIDWLVSMSEIILKGTLN